ncbi:hypothetical protein AADZ84_09090 [Colwelliaceae bacterium MEBiC 14330]
MKNLIILLGKHIAGNVRFRFFHKQNSLIKTTCYGVISTLIIPLYSCVYAADYDFSQDYKFWYNLAYNTAKNELAKSEVATEPEYVWSFDDGDKVFLSAKLLADLGGTLEVGDPYQGEPSSPSDRISIAGSNNLQFELREFYYQTYIADNLLVFGKQQIAWGQADGVIVLDIINPIRYREFILDDLEDARIPLWSAKYEMQFDNFDLQLVWVFDQTYSDFPNDDSEFSITSRAYRPTYLEPSPANFDVKPLDKPSKIISDSELGFQISREFSGWDLSFNYFYHYADNPVFPRYIDYENEIALVTVAETYKRTSTIGMSTSVSLDDYVLRSEWAYSTDRYVIDYAVDDYDGLLNTDELNYVVGLDYYGFSASLVSVQFYQSRLGEHKDTLSRDKNNTTLTMIIRNDFFNETFSTEGQWLYNTNDNDSLVRLSLFYKFNDFTSIKFGADMFGGAQNGLFGQFKESDQVYFEYIANF